MMRLQPRLPTKVALWERLGLGLVGQFVTFKQITSPLFEHLLSVLFIWFHDCLRLGRGGYRDESQLLVACDPCQAGFPGILPVCVLAPAQLAAFSSAR